MTTNGPKPSCLTFLSCDATSEKARRRERERESEPGLRLVLVSCLPVSTSAVEDPGEGSVGCHDHRKRFKIEGLGRITPEIQVFGDVGFRLIGLGGFRTSLGNGDPSLEQTFTHDLGVQVPRISTSLNPQRRVPAAT